MTKKIVALVVLAGLLVAGISYTSDKGSPSIWDSFSKAFDDTKKSLSDNLAKSAADLKAVGKSALDKTKSSLQQQAQSLKSKALAQVGKIAKATEELSFNEPSEVNAPSYLDKMALQKAANGSADKDDLYKYLEKFAPIVWLHPEDKYVPISAEEYYTSPESSVDRVVQEFPFKAGQVIPAGSVTFQKLYDIRQFAMGKSAPSLTDQEKSNIQKLLAEKNIKSYSGRGRLPIFIGIGKDVYYGSNPQLNKNAAGVLNTPAYALAFKAADGKIILQYVFIYGFNGPFRKGTAYLGAHEGDIEHITIELSSAGTPLNYFFKSHGGGSGIIVPAAQMVDVSQGGKALWNQAEKWGNRPIVYSAKKSHGNYPRGASGDKNNRPYEYTYVRAAGVLNDLTAKGTKWEPNYIRIYPETDSRFDAATMGWLYFPGAMGRRGVDSPYNQGWFMNFSEERKDMADKEGERLVTRSNSSNPLVSGTAPFELITIGRVQETIDQNVQRAQQAVATQVQKGQEAIARTQQTVTAGVQQAQQAVTSGVQRAQQGLNTGIQRTQQQIEAASQAATGAITGAGQAAANAIDQATVNTFGQLPVDQIELEEMIKNEGEEGESQSEAIG